MKREFPLFAETYFILKEDHISQSLFFHYHDPSKVYYNFIKTDAIEGELKSIQENLQTYIDVDALHINGHLVKMIIQNSKVVFYNNEIEFPVLCFSISSTPYSIYLNQLNMVHLYAKPEVIPYSAISCWNTGGVIKKVASNSYHTIDYEKQNVSFFLNKGDTVGGHERISFEFE